MEVANIEWIADHNTLVMKLPEHEITDETTVIILDKNNTKFAAVLELIQPEPEVAHA